MLSYFLLFILAIVPEGALNSENDHCQNKNDSSGNNITVMLQRFTDLWPVRDWLESGYFTEEYICRINVHWLSFAPPPRSSFIILGGIYINVMVVGLLGNFLVLYLFFRCKSLRTPGNILIANLAVSDGITVLKTPIFIYNCFHMGPALGDIACRVYGFIGGLSGTVSIVTLSAISFDRYFMIKFPLNRVYTNLRVKICLIIIWLYSLIFSLIPVLDIGLGKYTYEGYLTSCGFDYLTENEEEKYFIFVFFVAAWVVPFVLIIFSYVNIMKIVANRSVTDRINSFRHVKEEENKKQEIKLAAIVFGSICLWFVAWTPYAVVALLGIFDQKHLISPLSSMIPAVFCKITSCINPFVYALSHPKFKTELKKMACCSIRSSKQPTKVWTTQNPKNINNTGSYRESSDVEEEMVEFDVDPVPYLGQPTFEGAVKQLPGQDKYKSKPSFMEMFCLPPNFSNRSSTIRKMSRKWSTRKGQNTSREGD